MSQYCTIKGSITYLNKEWYDSAVAYLKSRGWLNENNCFCSEKGTEAITNTSTCYPEQLLIYIPYYCYRNLGSHLDTLFHGANEGVFIWGTVDGQYQAGIERYECLNGLDPWMTGHRKTVQLFDLEKWAAEPATVEELGEVQDNPEYWNDVVELWFSEMYELEDDFN